MSLGLVARADDTGLGNQSWEFHRHLRPEKTLIVDLTGMSASGKNLSIHPGRFDSGEVTVCPGIPDDTVLDSWLEGLSAVFTMETPYNYRLYTLARQRGIQTVLQANWELLDYLQPGEHQDHLPDILAMPSVWHLDDVARLFSDRMEVFYLPVPIPTDRWAETAPPESSCSRLLHVAGHPALADRNGTTDLLAALAHVRSEVTVTMTCQRPGYLGSLITAGGVSRNVTLVVDSASAEDYWGLYPGHDALVLPRRYGGLCLPLNEAIGAGIPALVPDISPNNRWLPEEWLTPASLCDTVMAKTEIEVYRTDPQALAESIDRIVSDTVLYSVVREQASSLSQRYSWDSLSPYYEEILR